MAKAETHDKEVELYRSLLEVPTDFKDGFGWTTMAGVLFCGLIMMPGAIYLGLMTGASLGPAASWVTVILFMEIARRALQPLKKEHLVVLLHAAWVMMAANALFPGGPMGQLVYRVYLAGSEAARDAGMTGAFPSWFVPPMDSPAVTDRNLLHRDWLVPVAIIAFLMVIGLVKKYTLGYFFFRLTSDVENLPFPLAPIAAQGSMALAEAEETVDKEPPEGGPSDSVLESLGRQASSKEKPKSMRWRVFSLGAVLGMLYGAIQVGIPGITGLFLSRPVFVIPQPFVDTTTLTEGILPATPTGVTLDMGIVLLGFVLPFWAVMGTFLAILLTMVLNPILAKTDVLTHWQPGMDTVNTTFANNIDFWLSFGIGAGLGIAAVSLYATIRDMTAKIREIRRRKREQAVREDVWATPKGRGDYPLWFAMAIYCLAGFSMIGLCYLLLPRTFGILFFLIFFTFVYNPFISYVNARLMGISGQTVDIPYVKEAAFLLSGAKGVEIWLAPVPVENYGWMAQSLRVNELTGVSFRSLLKTDLFALPVLFILSLLFWSFIWHSDPIPSDVFPAAQVNWELMAKNQVLLFSSTFVPPGEDPDEISIANSEFMKAIHPSVIGTGFFSCVILYAILTVFGLPVMLIYGMIRGFGQLPHFMILEVVGALLGRFYFQKKYGQVNFLRQAPALLAGYFSGVGLVSMLTMAMKLIQSAVSSAPW